MKPVVVVLAALVLAAIQPSVAPADLLGYWRFDGCTTSDASGHLRDLTAQGSPACIAGSTGQAWLLNGTNQFLERAVEPAFTPGTRGWTVAVWEKSTSAAAVGFHPIVSWYRCGANPGCTQADAALFSLGLDGGHPSWYLRDDNLASFVADDTVSRVTDDRWHLLVGTIRSARDSIKLYVDGALKKVLPAAVAPLSSGANPIPLEVGRWFRTGWGQPDFYFPGAVDEVRIYDEELSAASVAALYTGATAAVPIGDRPGLSIEGAPNPTRGSKLAVAFTLPGSEPARIALFDVAGRRVWSREVGALGAGRHQVDLADSRSLPSGTYLIQLTQGTHAVRGRVSVLR